MLKDYDYKSKFKLLDQVSFRTFFKADRWEDFNRKFFDGLAPKYDALNQVLSIGQHRRIKKRAIANTRLKSRQHILDLCTGSGDIAIFIAKQYPTCRVLGVDVSEKMLEIARKRSAGLANVTFQNADVLKLPFNDASFDTSFISFGLRNLRDLEQGLLEMKRVTRQGGSVVNLDLGKPRGTFLNWVHRLYFLNIIPFLGKTLFHRNEFNSFQYLPESSKYFPTQEKLVDIFKTLGFRNVQNHNFMLGAIGQQIGTV